VGQALGSPFDDISFLSQRVPGGAASARLAEVRVWASASAVYGLQCVWVTATGQQTDGPLHGSTANAYGSTMVTQSIPLGQDNILGVQGRMSLRTGLEAVAFQTGRQGLLRFGVAAAQAPTPHSAGQEFQLPQPQGTRALGLHGTAGPGGITSFGVWFVPA